MPGTDISALVGATGPAMCRNRSQQQLQAYVRELMGPEDYADYKAMTEGVDNNSSD